MLGGVYIRNAANINGSRDRDRNWVWFQDKHRLCVFPLSGSWLDLKLLSFKRFWFLPPLVLILCSKADATEQAQSGIKVMLLLLLFVLLLWPQGIYGMLRDKCLLTLEQGEVDPQNLYKSGDYSISGLISAMDARFKLLTFNRSPSTKFIE